MTTPLTRHQQPKRPPIPRPLPRLSPPLAPRRQWKQNRRLTRRWLRRTRPDAPDGAVSVDLVEWAIETDLEVAAGTVTFDVSNEGNFPHHFAIARGDSYEELPQIGGGAIDEDALGDDFIGRTENLQSGETEIIEFDLDPGNYVFFCNIAAAVSHAAQGQVLAVTVG